MRTTSAAVLDGPGSPFTVTDVELDGPRPREVLVRVAAAGICHTDLTVQDGGIPFPLPGVLGHEGAAVVEEVGSGVTAVRPGDRVLLSFASCGRCGNCLGGHPAYCDTWVVDNLITGARPDGTHTVHRGGAGIGGRFFGQSSFASHALVDESCLVPVGEEAPLEVLAPLGCGVQTGFGAVWNVLRPRAGATLVVMGVGGVGLAAVMASAQMPLRAVVAVDLVPERLALAAELGATHIIDTSTEDVSERLAEITGGRGADAVVESTGDPRVLRTAVDALAIRGECAIVGAPPAGSEVSLDVQGMLVGKRVVGVTLGAARPQRMLPWLVELHEAGRLPMERLVTFYSLDQINQATADMRAAKTVKPVLRFD